MYINNSKYKQENYKPPYALHAGCPAETRGRVHRGVMERHLGDF